MTRYNLLKKYQISMIMNYDCIYSSYDSFHTYEILILSIVLGYKNT